MNSFEVYIYFYYALDYIFDLTKSDALGDYLSGANPFLFEGCGSADPAIYDEFEKEFKNEFNTEKIDKQTAYNWLNKYLDILGNRAVKKAFKKITLQMWLDAVNSDSIS